jgi:hypothetical protein
MKDVIYGGSTRFQTNHRLGYARRRKQYRKSAGRYHVVGMEIVRSRDHLADHLHAWAALAPTVFGHGGCHQRRKMSKSLGYVVSIFQ